MKRFLYTNLLILLFFIASNSQTVAQQLNLDSLQAARQEYYFELKFKNAKEVFEIGTLVSIDEIKNDRCIAYANPQQYERLLREGYKPSLLLPPSLQHPVQNMMHVDDLRGPINWDAYPTYPTYVTMLQNFQTNFPNLCTIHTIATLNSGRQLLVARINNGSPAGKPEFFYTGTMHGDETTGYVLLLRLIDYLLNNYATNPTVKNLVDNMDIWINPLANPDGTYYAGNTTVIGSRRGNANNIDLNRNFPDPEAGQNPDGNATQPETSAMITFATNRNFVMSANTHGGIEVINYPWDTWLKRHADNNWWIMVSREYADTAQFFSPAGYMTALSNGITNGYDWYRITGGRQDYMTYFRRSREFTLELSNTKTLPASQLGAHWNYNYRSFLNYMKQTLYGFHGTVTDSVSGVPIKAKVEIVGFDKDNSSVFSALPAGNYHRPIKAGTYNLTFSADGYHTKTLTGLTIADRQKVVRNVQLVQGTIIANFTANVYEISKNGQVNFTDASFGQNITSWEWQFEGGVPSTSTQRNPIGITYPNTGSFGVQLKVTNINGQSHTINKPGLIKVTSTYVMANGTFTTCEGSFFDPGGPTANYGNSLTITTTFIPDVPEALTKVQFTMFDLEDNASCSYDYLKIYNGANINAPLIGTWCGTNSPGTIIASNPSKALTFQFKSDATVNKPGWAATISCFSTVSLNEEKKQATTLYPNPAKNQAVVINSDAPITQIKMSNTDGKLLLNEMVRNQNEFTLQTNHLKKGIFLVEITTTKGKSMQKLVVL